MDEPVFERDGERFVPTRHAAGPWDSSYLHGGAVSGLVARGVEELPLERPMHVARISLELLRPVPLEPLALSVTLDGRGKNVERVSVVVTTAAATVAGGTVLLVRAKEHDHDPVGPSGTLSVGVPEADEESFPIATFEGPAFHRTGMEIRAIRGGFDRPGPAAAWFRLRRPLVAGETPTALQIAAAAADFGNGLSWTIPADRWVFINPDLTIHFSRPPVGDRIGLDAATLGDPTGFAMAESALFDERGRIGRSVQSLYVDTRRA